MAYLTPEQIEAIKEIEATPAKHREDIPSGDENYTVEILHVQAVSQTYLASSHTVVEGDLSNHSLIQTLRGKNVSEFTQIKAHKHDCDACTYVGTTEVKGATFDMYICLDNSNRLDSTAVARFGKDGDCISAPFGILDRTPALIDYPPQICLDRYRGSIS